jgi:hypothetical protein
MNVNELIVSIATSFVASYLFFYYLRFRENNISKKIAEIDSDEIFIEKISKGNVRLLRSTFFIILLSIAFCCVSFSVFFIANAYQFAGMLRKYSNIFSAWLLFLSAGICLTQARYILLSADLTSTRRKFQEKREALQNKIGQNK